MSESAKAVLGSRPPREDVEARRLWNRRYRELRKDHFTAYRAARKAAKAQTPKDARAEAEVAEILGPIAHGAPETPAPERVRRSVHAPHFRQARASRPKADAAPKPEQDPRLVVYQTRAGVLASGLVRIVKTPKQLDTEGGWWSPEKSGTFDRRLYAQSLSLSLPHWLRPVKSPREEALAQIRTAEQLSRRAAPYVAGGSLTVPADMSDAQRKAALGAIARRLAGQPGSDSDLDMTVKE